LSTNFESLKNKKIGVLYQKWEEFMFCANHPEVEAVTTCASCGKQICATCSNPVMGKTICPDCLAMGRYDHPQSVSSSSTNILAIISLVSVVLGLLGCGLCGSFSLFIGGAVGAVTGFLGRRQISQPGSTQGGASMATISMWLGVAEIALGVVVILVAGAFFGLSMLSGGSSR
jgi:hypothetical protein